MTYVNAISQNTNCKIHIMVYIYTNRGITAQTLSTYNKILTLISVTLQTPHLITCINNIFFYLINSTQKGGFFKVYVYTVL